MNQVSSQASSVSSCDDYIVLPDCFDTSRPLGESVHGSAAALPAITALTSADEPREEEEEKGSTFPAQGEREEQREEVEAEESAENVNQLLCTSQTLDAVMLTPEVVPAPVLPPTPLYSPRLDQPPGPRTEAPFWGLFLGTGRLLSC